MTGLALIFSFIISVIYFWGLLIKKKFNKLVFLLLLLILVFLQFSNTQLKNVYSQTPSQIDKQITRMHYYPVKLTRLAYYLEYKKPTLYIYKLQENFFDAIDLETYFPDYFTFIYLPFFLIGIYDFFESKNSFFIKTFLSAIVFLTIVGVNSKGGPILIFPFIYLFILIGVYRLVGKIYAKK